MRWMDLYNKFMTDQQSVIELAAHAWRQAAAAAGSDSGLRITLAMNQYSPSGICDTLDWRGYPPDALTMQWANQAAGDGPPSPFNFIPL